MRRIAMVIAWSLVIHYGAFAGIVTHWNFNSTLPDADFSTGTTDPAEGSGIFRFVGGATNLFGNVGGGTESDPALDDDSQIRITRLPSQGANNRAVGIEFRVSTRGYTNIWLRWDQYNSATASRFWRVQFSSDALDWIAHDSIVQTHAGKWVNFSVSFQKVPELNDRDEIHIRIVPEFESTATGAGVEGYVAVNPTSNYSTAGSWWIDSLTISEGEAVSSAGPQDVFASWNFNTLLPDNNPQSGTLDPEIGSAEVIPKGVGSATFNSVGQAKTSDPALSDNSMLRLGGFPRQGTSNDTTGIELRASTVGYERIGLRWDQYNSATASRFLAIQITTNGTDFNTHDVLSNSSAGVWIKQRFVGFEGFPVVENNPKFGVRVVSTFGPNGGYEAVSSNSTYSTAGTLWLDMIQLVGQPIERPDLRLFCRSDGEEIVISWPKEYAAHRLQTRDAMTIEWREALEVVEEADQELQVRIVPNGEQRFFRLRP